MKIVMNGLQLKKQSSGIGILIYNLYPKFVKSIEKNVTIILSKDSPSFLTAPKNMTIIRNKYNKNQVIKRNLFQSFFMGRLYCKNSIFITVDTKVPFFMPYSCETVPIITDLAVYRMPHVYQLSRVIYWKIQYRYIVKKAKRFVAISEFTKNEMCELLDIPSEKIDVVYCSCDEKIKKVTSKEELERVRNKYKLPSKYLLFVGNFNPRKNLERILLAFDELIEKGSITHKLVIVGESGWKFDKKSALSKLKHKDKIMFTGYGEEKDMSAIYTMADLFLFPTLYEGFGIPIIEAQRCETAVIASNTSSLPEIGGDGAYYVDPYKIKDIKNAIKILLENNKLKANLIEKGKKNATRFSWEESGRQLSEIIKKIN